MSLYTPWTEDWHEIHARTQGREEVVEAIVLGAKQLVSGGRPLPLYLFGPRGVGKSHVVCDALGQVRDNLTKHGFTLISIGEDAAVVGDADALWTRMAPSTTPAWMAWDRSAAPGPERALVVFEGLDRQLAALGDRGRKRLRALLDAHPEVWFVATGARLTSELTDKDEALYSAFRSLPVLPLDDAHSAELVDREAGEESAGDGRWPARRAAIVLLAGGNPRALVALGRAVRTAPGQEVAKRLLAVLDEFTPHYQLRFRDLAPQEQQLVELLSQAPRELGPTEISRHLGSQPAAWSTAAYRLSDLGIVRIDQPGGGRNAYYRIAEPLFRYWLEFRRAPWGETRIAWLGALLELVLGPAELVEMWAEAPDEALRTAALGAIRRKPEGRKLAWERSLQTVQHAIGVGDVDAVGLAVGSALPVVPGPSEAWSLARELASGGFAAAGRKLGPSLTEHGRTTLGRLLSTRGDAGELRGVLSELGSARCWQRVTRHPLDGYAVVRFLDVAAAEMDPRGQPWALGAEERRTLRDVPFVRSRLARHGRRTTHAPLLDEADLLLARIDGASPDLGDLLSLTVARRYFSAAARVVAAMQDAEDARLPHCPWPGRRLTLDAVALLELISRRPSAVALTWLAATLPAPDDAFARLVQPGLPEVQAVRLRATSMELAFGAIALARPDRLELLRAALSHPSWSGTFARVDILAHQLREADRGPLHPELAVVYDALRPR